MTTVTPSPVVTARTFAPGDKVRRKSRKGDTFVLAHEFIDGAVTCWTAWNQRTQGMHTLRADDIRRVR